MNDRVDNLDLLRAMAIVMVVFFHLPTWVGWPDSPLQILVQGWWSGVDLFFVLSGYLVGGLFWRELAKDGEVRLFRFVLRRLLRTVPPYLVALHLIYAYKWASTGAAEYDWHYLLFLQNYSGLSIFSVSWSLCVEEHFYLIAPFLFLWVGRARQGWVLLAVAAIPLFSRLLFTQPPASPFGPHYFLSHNHFEGLAVGAWLSYVITFHAGPARLWAARARYLLWPCLLGILGLKFFAPSLYIEGVIGYTWLAAGFGLILLVGVHAKPWPLAKSVVVKLIARQSYSLYLTHTYVMLVAHRFILPRLELHSALADSLVVLTLALGVGYLFYRLVERPAFWLRDRLTGETGARNVVKGANETQPAG
jgi:peptidoglycan/LPS O-acetylase OafA/YrhL